METSRVLLRKGVYYNKALSCLVSAEGNIHLTPNEKKLLDIILDQRGRKDTIIDEIWHQQGMVVSEASYYQLVKMLRKKFMVAGLEACCLKTIPRFGIVFINDSSVISEELVEKVPITEPFNAIGPLLTEQPEKKSHLLLNKLNALRWLIIRPYKFYLNVVMMFLISVLVNLILKC